MKTILLTVLLLFIVNFSFAAGPGSLSTEIFSGACNFQRGIGNIKSAYFNLHFPKCKPVQFQGISNLTLNFESQANAFPGHSFFKGDPQKPFAEKIKTRTWISGSLFAASLATGYLLSPSNGKPNTALLTVHKLSSASNLVMLDVTLFQKNKITRLTTGEKIIAVLMNAAFVATIGTGGRLSMEKPAPNSIKNIHKISPYVTTISAGTLLYLLNKN